MASDAAESVGKYIPTATVAICTVCGWVWVASQKAAEVQELRRQVEAINTKVVSVESKVDSYGDKMSGVQVDIREIKTNMDWMRSALQSGSVK